MTAGFLTVIGRDLSEEQPERGEAGGALMSGFRTRNADPSTLAVREDDDWDDDDDDDDDDAFDDDDDDDDDFFPDDDDLDDDDLDDDDMDDDF
ncbi:MAG: hypothetical protein PVI86_02055 [Phycisphaerae bacterium]|jgi:hypothetical protein